MKTTFRYFLLTSFASLALVFNPVIIPAAGLQTSGTSPAKNSPARPPSDQELSDAKSKGMVWVNTSTHVYHKSDSSLYGKTKRGKFMTEDDAKKGGFRAANESGKSKKTTATNK